MIGMWVIGIYLWIFLVLLISSIYIYSSEFYFIWWRGHAFIYVKVEDAASNSFIPIFRNGSNCPRTSRSKGDSNHPTPFKGMLFVELLYLSFYMYYLSHNIFIWGCKIPIVNSVYIAVRRQFSSNNYGKTKFPKTKTKNPR